MKRRSYSAASTLGPFLRLTLALVQQRSRTNAGERVQAPAPPLSSAALTDVMTVVSATEPSRLDPQLPGPFLTLILTLCQRSAEKTMTATLSFVRTATEGSH